MREIKISQETASRWYNGTDTELKALAIQTYPELAVKELPKNWEELGKIEGYYTDSDSGINATYNNIAVARNKDIFATKEQASASIAMAQLSQLMAVYNDGWVADWTDTKYKYNIYYTRNELYVSHNASVKRFLHFKDYKTAELFLENFSELIQTAKPLL